MSVSSRSTGDAGDLVPWVVAFGAFLLVVLVIAIAGYRREKAEDAAVESEYWAFREELRALRTDLERLNGLVRRLEDESGRPEGGPAG